MKYGLSDTVVKELQNVFRGYDNVQRVIIFGSRAKGNYRIGSDVDLAVVGDSIGYSQLLDMKCKIDDADLLYKVDLVDYNKNKNTPIGAHIDRVGKIFYQAS